MINLFFANRRCPLSLSLAGYLINNNEKCVESLDDVQWIIPGTNETRLCYAAANVLDLINNHQTKRIFVQQNSRNFAAVILGSFLSGTPVFCIDYDAKKSTELSNRFKELAIPISSKQTRGNFISSAFSNCFADENLDERATATLSCFPPTTNWFDNYTILSFVGMNAQTLNNYKLPNFINQGDRITESQSAQAFHIRKFFKLEATSSWKNFQCVF